MNARRTIVVAMSGGVDSSVAAALLREAGHDVVGVFMCMGIPPLGGHVGPGSGVEAAPAGQGHQSCCSPQDSADARAVALRLGIPFHVLDFARPFDELIEYFVDEYSRGRTPNPCVRCNSRLKFGRLLEIADSLGAGAVATGHYARMVETPAGPRLAAAADRAKDQSYVLFELPAGTLRRVVLPLGEWTKERVRDKAASLGLAVADKPESQDICFAPAGLHGRLIEQRRPGSVRPGDVLDAAGRIVGRHRGYQHYTVGQRRGLGIAAGSPIYVTAIDAAANTVTVGSADMLLRTELTCSGVAWHDPAGSAADGSQVDCTAGGMGRRAFVKIRYRAPAAAATVTPVGQSRARVAFDVPASAITPGQAAVFYDDSGMVLGGGWID